MGIDCGTGSVGLALTDDKYHPLRRKGKDMMFSRTFNEAKTAQDRRLHRSARNTLKKERRRRNMLWGYFKDEIDKIDPLFIKRLKNSLFFTEDKDPAIKTRYILFNDDKFTDREYFKKYPTISHLVADLINSPEPHDVRLVLIALMHKFSHRGHFLYDTLDNNGNVTGMKELYGDFQCLLNSPSMPENPDTEKIEKILGDRTASGSWKKKKLMELLDISHTDKRETAYIALLCGLKAQTDVLTETPAPDRDSRITISFSDFAYEEKIPEIREALGDEEYCVLEAAQAVYSRGVLAGIMGGHRYLCEARIESYQTHGKQLKLLKKVIRENCPKEEYGRMFRSQESGTYGAYVNSCLSCGNKTRRGSEAKGRNRENLYKNIRRLLKDVSGPDSEYIRDQIDQGTFLPKQSSRENGVIPNQVHLAEVKAILENAENYLPFLKEKDAGGRTVSERILALFKFTTPYYVGPLGEGSKTGWLVRKEDGRILPWNFSEKVDLQASSKKFIMNMVRECSYFSGEHVLPKNSLTYEKFTVLDCLNTIKIDGKRIGTGLKQEIYTKLFAGGRKVTQAGLAGFLKKNGHISETDQVSGYETEKQMASHKKFLDIFGEKLEEKKYQAAAENIIFWHTVFGNLKKLTENKIRETYGNLLTEEEITKSAELSFGGWGKLSERFILMQGMETGTGKKTTLLDALWETDRNHMELIHSEQYSFKQVLDGEKKTTDKSIHTFSYNDLDEYGFNAPVKRTVWQALRMIKEGVELAGADPSMIFIEMAKTPGRKGKRSTPREKELMRLYEKSKPAGRDWQEEIRKAAESGILSKRKVYLWFLQKGKDIYTGKDIPLDELLNGNMYDTDHIYARSLTNDNSIKNNLVLVRKDINSAKSDGPVGEDIILSQKPNWQILVKEGFMTKEKYTRLTRCTPLTEEEKTQFIARQLVETQCGTKSLGIILGQLFPKTEIVYVRAHNVSDFRKKFSLPKLRNVNDEHHAYDAYLNIVVGNAYYTKFTSSPARFMKKRAVNAESYNLGKMFDRDIARNGRTAWEAPGEDLNGGTIDTVRKVLKKQAVLVTRQPFTFCGGFAKDNLTCATKSGKSPDKYMPLKTSDRRLCNVGRYGGYANMSTAYFFLVESGTKKRKRTIETVPASLSASAGDPGFLEEYCRKIGLSDPNILIPKIHIGALMEKNGFRFHITGKSGNALCMRNAESLHLSEKEAEYADRLEDALASGNMHRITKEENTWFYGQLLKRHTEGKFKKRPNSMGEKLSEWEGRFLEKEPGEQCAILLQVLNLSAQVPGSSADLSAIGGGTSCGSMRISRTVDGDTFLVHQSVTGMKERKVRLGLP